jgi:hypothetical protein
LYVQSHEVRKQYNFKYVGDRIRVDMPTIVSNSPYGNAFISSDCKR